MSMEELAFENIELKRAAEDALQALEALRHENETFRKNFDAVRGAYENLSGKTDEYKRQINELNEAKRTLEAQADERTKILQSQLDIKELELDEAINRRQPAHELELLKLKMVEELEVPHRQQMKMLQLTELMQQNEDLTEELEQLRSAHDGTVRTFHSQITTLQEALESTTDDETIRALEKQIADLQERYKQALDELSQVRTDREKLKSRYESSERSYMKQLSEEKSAARALSNERELFYNKSAQLEEDLREMHRLNEEMKDQLSATEHEYASTRNQLEDTYQNLNNENNTLKMQYQEQRSRWNIEREQLKRQLAEVQRQFDDLQATEQEKMDKMILQMERQRSQENETRRHLEEQIAQKEQQIEKMEQQQEELLNVVHREEDEHRKEMLSMQATLRAAERDMESRKERIEREINPYEEQLAEADAKIRRMQKEAKAAARLVAELEAEEQTNRIAYEQNHSRIQMLQREIESNKDLYQRNIETLQDKLRMATRRPETEEELEAKVQKLKKQLKHTLLATKKERDGLNKKVQSSSQKLAAYDSRIKDTQADHDSKIMEVRILQSKLNESERRREELEVQLTHQRNLNAPLGRDRHVYEPQAELTFLNRHLRELENYQTEQMQYFNRSTNV
ncbi:hypothetical protein PROFUN_00500 [Planoprotostelium fungivorum]|uniref:Uncharacterized protein n=1 Tax=Planoprotostelium fungivorum TaxID=1890364 RepID=A0A2P6N108_9EUKA|nr:hypothetical protein PROFUN_00500 [Planoprotostelium fungivorum]